MSMNKKEIRNKVRMALTEGKAKKIVAGVLVKSEDTDNILLLLRSNEGRNGNTWNLVAGGIESGESVLEGLKREVKEEMDINPDIITYNFIKKIDIPEENMVFHYYEGFTNSEFIPTLDHENTDYGWFGKDELPSPLFPKIITKINNIWKTQN